MKPYLIALAQEVRERLQGAWLSGDARSAQMHSPGGDPQLGVDMVAEQAVWEFITSRPEPVALFSEAFGLRTTAAAPEHVLVVDPIDGTRPFAAGFPLSMTSIAIAPLGSEPTLDSVDVALLMEPSTGAYIGAERGGSGVFADGYPFAVPRLRDTVDLDKMYWAMEFNGHPARIMTAAYGNIIDASAHSGAVFVFSSASYAISRIITGQLDAYLDIGNRLLREHPVLREQFVAVGGGTVQHLFPYDIAASVLIAEQAGVTITDGFGKSLTRTRLLDVSEDNQQSCVAAATPALHARILEAIDWQLTTETTTER